MLRHFLFFVFLSLGCIAFFTHPSISYAACVPDVKASVTPAKYNLETASNFPAEDAHGKRTLTVEMRASDDCLGPIHAFIPGIGYKDNLEKNKTYTFSTDSDTAHLGDLVKVNTKNNEADGVDYTQQKYPGARVATLVPSMADACLSGNAVTVQSCDYVGAGNEKRCGALLNVPGGAVYNDPNAPAYESRISDITSNLEVVMNPDYVTTQQKDRKFTPKTPASPIDNFVVEFDGKTCPGGQLSLLADLIAIDDKGKEVIIVGGNHASEFSPGRYGYVFNGWPNGLPNAETLIDSIAHNRRVFVRVYEPAHHDKKNEKDITMTNCAQVYGQGEHGVVMMTSKDFPYRTPSNLLTDSDGLRQKGFEVIDPYKNNADQFSHFIDLHAVDDGSWKLYGTFKRSFYYNGPSKIKSLTSCSNATQYVFLNQKTYIAYSTLYGGVNIINLFKIKAGYGSDIVMHEVGHSFAGLLDEYTPPVNFFDKFFFKRNSSDRNCSGNPLADFSYNGKQFGAGTEYKGCLTNSDYRPSKNSLMNDTWTESRMNVVGCGYVLRVIKGGDAKSYWPECGRMDVVDPYFTASK